MMNSGYNIEPIQEIPQTYITELESEFNNQK